MKLVWKIVSIAAVILLLLGIMAIVASLITGGSVEGIRNNVMLTNFEQDFKDELPAELHITCSAGKLTVLPGDTLRVEACNVAENGFVCTLRDGVLTVGENRVTSWSDNLARVLSLRKEPPEICIYLPEGTSLQRAEIELTTGSAELTLPGTAADYTAGIKAGVGAIRYDGHSCSLTETSIGNGAAVLALRSMAGRMEVSFQG